MTKNEKNKLSTSKGIIFYQGDCNQRSIITLFFSLHCKSDLLLSIYSEQLQFVIPSGQPHFGSNKLFVPSLGVPRLAFLG